MCVYILVLIHVNTNILIVLQMFLLEMYMICCNMNIVFLQAYVRHPELAAAKSNRDYVLRQVCDAVNTISDVAQAKGQSQAHPYEGAGELASALDEFDVGFSSMPRLSLGSYNYRH